MRICDLFEESDSKKEVKDIKINSKKVERGDIFVCTSGVNFDRHDFIDEAVKNGASLIVVSKDIKRSDVEIIKVENTDKFLPVLARKLYDFHREDFKIVAVTGTDGKTTTAETIYKLIGKDAGYLGTNGYKTSKHEGPLVNTTPDSDLLYKYFKLFKEDGVKIIVMEVSSEAMLRKRLEGLYFDVVILTNVTRDHLNVHKTLENYINCKKEVFSHLNKDGLSIINSDDSHYDEFKILNKNVISYGLGGDYKLINYSLDKDYTKFTYSYKGKKEEVKSPLKALFNIYNLMAAIACLDYLGYDYKKNLDKLKVEGRLEFINEGQGFTAIVDFAHTPNSIKNALSYASSIKTHNLIVLTGQAGERDEGKRPIIGKILEDFADKIILTYDDPHREDPKRTIDMIMSGMDNKEKVEVIIDRKKALERLVDLAGPGDVIIALGKGSDSIHLAYPKNIHLSDIDEIKNNIKRKEAKNA